MKELREPVRDLWEDNNLHYKADADYLLRADNSDRGDDTYLENVTSCGVNAVMCEMQELDSQNRKKLGRYLQYIESVEEYEASRK